MAVNSNSNTPSINFRQLVVNVNRTMASAMAQSRVANLIVVAMANTNNRPDPNVQDITEGGLTIKDFDLTVDKGTALTFNLVGDSYADFTLDAFSIGGINLLSKATLTKPTADGDNFSIAVASGWDVAIGQQELILTLSTISGVKTFNFTASLQIYDSTATPTLVNLERVDLSNKGNYLTKVTATETDQVFNFKSHIDLATVITADDLDKLITTINDRYDFFSFVVLTKAVTDLFLTNKIECKLPIMLTAEDENTANDLLTAQYGVMLDPNFQGNAVYALSSVLQITPNAITYTNQVKNPAFSGITNKAEADRLEGKLYSFWFNSIQKCYPYSLFIAGKQFVVLAYICKIDEVIMDALASLVDSGVNLIEAIDSLEVIIKGAFNGYLDKLDNTPTITIPTIEQLSNSDKIKGVISGVTVNYSVMGELRSITINVGGN